MLESRQEAKVHPTSATEKKTQPEFPVSRWCLYLIALWLLLGCVPTLIVLVGTSCFSLAGNQTLAVAGTIGDAFGLVNSLFSGFALLLVIWSLRLQMQEIRFARDEWKENTATQVQQANTMRDAAALSAANHIYSHYSKEYGCNDVTFVLSAIASGHRRWAIRESFANIDPVFEPERLSQVRQDADRLCVLFSEPQANSTYLCEVAANTSSLLVEKRIDTTFRRLLWPIYEMLRSQADQLCSGEAQAFNTFKDSANEAHELWQTIRSIPEIRQYPN